ncbi:MAG TPA: hypothetical protein VN088_16570 [Nocardioides sp.]|nr:hypothetical protein [Nocardioides sp.]
MSADRESTSADVVGFDVEALHHTGATVTARAAAGGTAARRLVTGLDSAHGGLGHPSVRQALQSFLTTDVTHHAHHLAADITAAGHDVSNVAATGRNSDDEAARDLAPHLQSTESAYTSIHARIQGE